MIAIIKHKYVEAQHLSDCGDDIILLMTVMIRLMFDNERYTIYRCPFDTVTTKEARKMNRTLFTTMISRLFRRCVSFTA